MSETQVNMPGPLLIRGSLVAKNSVLNLLGQAVPMAIGLFAVRITIRSLGPERFGILTLIWAVVGYFGFLDFGLGTATNKFGSELVGRNELRLMPRLFWTSLVSVAILGGVSAAAFAALAPALARKAFHLPLGLSRETDAALLIVSVSLPVLFATGVARGILAAFQRFDLINLVQVPAASASYIIPAAAALLGYSLPVIAGALVAARGMAAVALLLLSLRLLPAPFSSISIDRRLLRQLFGYGGWVTLGGLIGPLLAYVDRFLIGAFSSMRALAQYSAPLDLTGRLAAIPGSVSASVFPAFSALRAVNDKARQRELLARSGKLLVLMLAPACFFLFGFARDVIRLWLGAEYVANSGSVLQIFALGSLLIFSALLPLTVIQANGRPDLVPKFYLLEAVVYIPLAWPLITRFGALGAAWAWAVHIGLDAALLWWGAARLIGVRLGALPASGAWRSSAPVGVLLVFTLLTSASVAALPLRAAVAAIALATYAAAVWKFSLDDGERCLVASNLRQLRGLPAETIPETTHV